jgi:hypothetical protein
MRTLLIAGILCTGIFLTGCVPFFVERRHDREHYDDGRHSYGDTHYRDDDNGSHDR